MELPPELLEGDYPAWPERWTPAPSLVETGPSPVPDDLEPPAIATAAEHPTLPAESRVSEATPPSQGGPGPVSTAPWPPAPAPAPAATPTPSLTVPGATPPAVCLWLDPRDPFSLVAHWQMDPTALSRWMPSLDHDALRLRVHAHNREGLLMTEQVVSASTRHRIVPVLYPETPYVGDLGFINADGIWCSLAVSEPASTPPDASRTEWTHHRGHYLEPERRASERQPEPEASPAAMTSPEPRSPDAIPILEGAPAENVEPLPSAVEATYLATLVWEPEPPRLSAGHSADLAEAGGRWVTIPQVVLHPLPHGPSSPAPVHPRVPGESDSLPSSPAPGRPAPAPGDFWFKVNAELIVYGSTEPDASVTVAGRPIHLREDGSFSFRFSLPDGQYSLPAIAVKADGSDTRSAHLEFSRTTRYSGEVGLHPQDPALQPPVAGSPS